MRDDEISGAFILECRTHVHICLSFDGVHHWNKSSIFGYRAIQNLIRTGKSISCKWDNVFSRRRHPLDLGDYRSFSSQHCCFFFDSKPALLHHSCFICLFLLIKEEGGLTSEAIGFRKYSLAGFLFFVFFFSEAAGFIGLW